MPPRRSASVGLVEDACADLAVTTRSMFGGLGFFAPNGGMFAMVIDDLILLKFEEGTKGHEAFVALGGRPWVYEGKPRSMTMREWLVVPTDLFDEPRDLADWCARAHAAAPPKTAKKRARSR